MEHEKGETFEKLMEQEPNEENTTQFFFNEILGN